MNLERERELDRNYDYFQQHISEFARANAGRFALLRHQQLVQFFDTLADAVTYADAHFPDRLFSVQPVEPDPVDLGFIGRA